MLALLRVVARVHVPTRLAWALWAFLLLAGASEAHAESSLHGAVDGRGMFEISGRKGGLLTTDLWFGPPIVRFGVVLGVGALSEGKGYSSSVLTPFGASLALQPLGDASGPTLALRGGGYTGGDKDGFYFAGWTGGALGYRIDLGEGASVRLGLDAWALFGRGNGFFLAPYLGLGF